MPARDIDQLGDLQAAVMDVLWERGEATVKDVLDALPADPAPAYTTVLTILQKLTKAGWVTHRSLGRSYVYTPLCSRDEAGRSAIRRFVDKVFAGDRVLAFQQLISESPLEDEELDTLRAMIETRRKEQDDD